MSDPSLRLRMTSNLNPDFIASIERARQQKAEGQTKTLAAIRAEYTESGADIPPMGIIFIVMLSAAKHLSVSSDPTV